MQESNTRRNTWLFLGAVVLSGLAHVADTYATGLASSLLFTLNNGIYMALVLFWVNSVHRRLLPSRARQHLIAMGLLMLLFQLERMYKYRFASRIVLLARLTWYAYYIPLIFMMTLFWMSCLCLGRSDEERGRERWLLIPAGLLTLGVFTNDLHQLAFVTLVPLSEQNGTTGTYSYGPLFGLSYAWMGLCLVMGLVALLRASHRLRDWRLALRPLLFVLLWIAHIAIERYLNLLDVVLLFKMPEATVFCLIGFCEVCIRQRLVPYNENYGGFFSAMTLPALIADRRFEPAYVSAAPLEAGEAQLRAALETAVYPREGIRLQGRPIRAGYVFWTVDERELAAQEREIDASNRALEAENDLIRAETAMREEQERLALRGRLFRRVSAELAPTVGQLQVILDSADPDAPDLPDKIRQIAVLGSYVKRKSDLLLRSMEHETLDSRTLRLSLEEMARYLAYCGVEASVADAPERPLPSRDAVALFDSFAALVDALLPGMRRLIVALNETGLRLCTDAPRPDALPETPLKVDLLEADDLLYLTVRAGEGGSL